MKHRIEILVLALAAVLSFVFAAVELPYFLDTEFDEGFLYESLQQTLHGYISGDTQYNNILMAVFSDATCHSILRLRTYSYLCVCLTVLLVFGFTVKLVAKDKQTAFEYFVLCAVIASVSLGGFLFNYNRLTELFQCTAVAIGYLILMKDSNLNFLWSGVLGFVLTFALFTKLPSALLLTAALYILLVIRYWSNYKKILFLSGATLVGMGLGLLLMHVCVVDLCLVFDAMEHTSKTIVNIGRGYDPISLVTRIVLFLRDFGFCILMVVAIVVVVDRLNSITWLWLGGLFGVIFLLAYAHYQVKPLVTTPMLMSMLWIPIIIEKSKSFVGNWRDLLNFDNLMTLFLVFAPILICIGTNTYLGGCMRFVLLPWAILIMHLTRNSDQPRIRLDIAVVAVLLLLLPYSSLVSAIKNDTYVCEQGPAKGMHLNILQKAHFDKCEAIMNEYSYERNKSVILGIQSVMTTCYFEGVNSATYSDVNFMVGYAQYRPMKKPDFIFLESYEEKIVDNLLRTQTWGWPDEFDKFEVGHPVMDIDDPNHRYVYCRKSLRVK